MPAPEAALGRGRLCAGSDYDAAPACGPEGPAHRDPSLVLLHRNWAPRRHGGTRSQHARLLVIGGIVCAVTTVIPAVVVPGRIVGTVTTGDSTAIVADRIVRPLTTGEPAAIITRRIVCALTTREPAFVIPGRIAGADPILLGKR